MRVRLFEGELLPGLPYLRNLTLKSRIMLRGELLLGLPYLRNHPHTPEKASAGELLFGLRYFRNCIRLQTAGRSGELLLGLPYLRNEWNAPRLSVKVSYCLVCGTSEIPVPTDALPARVNYRLVYDVFETGAIAAGTLIAGELLLDLRYLRNLSSM